MPTSARLHIYQLGGMLYEIQHQNGVTWRQTPKPTPAGASRQDRDLRGPADNLLWSTGDYSYDGAGNISAIGTRKYVHDAYSRFSFVRNNNVTPNEQVATYDAYGNLTSLAKFGVTRPLHTDTASNRLTIDGIGYTSNGEVAISKIDGVDFAYGYDGLGQQLFQQSTTKTWLHVYDANDERVLTWECALNLCGEETNFERYTLRGLSGEVLRTFEGPGRVSLEWKEDYVYRDGQPLAWIKAPAAGAGEIYQFLHADHLGSTRLVTSATGTQVSRHDFLPFGEESTVVTGSDVDLKFTGHERDQPGKPHDNMHARFYSPSFGRFLRTDEAAFWELQVGSETDRQRFQQYLARPQVWNRYPYANNNPIKYVDPDGREATLALGGTFVFGSSAAAGSAGAAVTSGVVAGAAITGAGVVGWVVGSLVNEIPGVSSSTTKILESVIQLAQNNGQKQTRIDGLIAAAALHVGTINAAGGPSKDPDFKHHKHEIKVFLQQAKKIAKRLPTKARESAMKRIDEIANKVGVELL